LTVTKGDPDPSSNHWLGLSWAAFANLPVKAPDLAGVYRLVKEGKLLYVGESRSLRSRLSTHSKDIRFLGCEVSYHSMPDASPHQLKERETDLIGSCLLHTKQSPLFQYSPLPSVEGQLPVSGDSTR
jgi:hypothetical protein